MLIIEPVPVLWVTSGQGPIFYYLVTYSTNQSLRKLTTELTFLILQVEVNRTDRKIFVISLVKVQKTWSCTVSKILVLNFLSIFRFIFLNTNLFRISIITEIHDEMCFLFFYFQSEKIEKKISENLGFSWIQNSICFRNFYPTMYKLTLKIFS